MTDTSKRNVLLTVLAILGTLVLAMMSMTEVPETKQAVITSYGEYRRTINPYRKNDVLGTSTQAGLTFRIPFVEQLQLMEKRIMKVDMEPQELQSTDQLRLRVDAFARFRIVNPLQMYKSVRTEERLRTQMATFLSSSVRGELGKRSFITLLSPERSEVMANIQKSLNRQGRNYGVEVIDVRIKRTDLPKTTLKSAYSRMESAREQEATSIQALGQKEAQIIRADAEAAAAQIYAQSYGKDPEFYDFYRAMQSYRYTFQSGQGQTNFVLSPNSEYLRRFQKGG